MDNEPTKIVNKPLITEKSTMEAERYNRYAFEVDPRANKLEIQEAIRRLYSVRVAKVRTQRRRGKFRRTRFGWGKTRDWKRAVVELHPDDRIELF